MAMLSTVHGLMGCLQALALHPIARQHSRCVELQAHPPRSQAHLDFQRRYRGDSHSRRKQGVLGMRAND